MSAFQRVEWDQWGGGDRGHLSDRAAGLRSPFRYDALNLVYDHRENALVYRPGTGRLLTVAGSSGVECIGMGWAQFSTRELWFVLRNLSTSAATVYLANTLTGAVVLVGTAGNVAGGLAVEGIEHPGGLSYLVFPGLGLFLLNHVTPSLTQIGTGSGLGGRSLAVYGDRLYVGGNIDGVANRIQFSTALDFADFPALNFFDVGPGAAVRYITQQRGHLTIATEDGTWWVLNGLAKAGGSLRRVASSAMQPWEFFPQACVIDGEDVIWFVPLPHDYPCTFNGAQVQTEHERSIDFNDISQPGAGPGRYTVKRMTDPGEVVFRSGMNPALILLNRRGAWTRQAFTFPQGKPYMASDQQSWVYLAGMDGTDFAIYRFNYGHISPGRSDALNTEPPADINGTAHDAQLHLPEWWHPEGGEVTVRSVTVEVRGWGALRGAAQLTASARALGRGDVDYAESTGVARLPATFTGTRSLTVHLGEQGSGRGFQVRLSGIRFLSILRVVADVAVDPPRQGR